MILATDNVVKESIYLNVSKTVYFLFRGFNSMCTTGTITAIKYWKNDSRIQYVVTA